MTYDGDGKRRSYEDSAALRKFIWDGENILWQTDSANSAVVHYTHRPQTYGELVCPEFHGLDNLVWRPRNSRRLDSIIRGTRL